MLAEDAKKRIYADALEAEAELIERDLTVETVREWLGAIDDTEILCIITRYRRQLKAANDINRDVTYRQIGKDLCVYIEQCVMDAATFQVECRIMDAAAFHVECMIDEIYAEAEK